MTKMYVHLRAKTDFVSVGEAVIHANNNPILIIEAPEHVTVIRNELSSAKRTFLVDDEIIVSCRDIARLCEMYPESRLVEITNLPRRTV